MYEGGPSVTTVAPIVALVVLTGTKVGLPSVDKDAIAAVPPVKNIKAAKNETAWGDLMDNGNLAVLGEGFAFISFFWGGGERGRKGEHVFCPGRGHGSRACQAGPDRRRIGNDTSWLSKAVESQKTFQGGWW